MRVLLLATVLVLGVFHKLVIFGMAFLPSAVCNSLLSLPDHLGFVRFSADKIGMCPLHFIRSVLLLLVSLESTYSKPAAVSIFHRFSYLAVLSSRCSFSVVGMLPSSFHTDSFLLGSLNTPRLHEPCTNKIG